MSTTGAAFSVRFLRNGDQVVIVRNIINRKGSGRALFQVVEPNTGVVTPNWDATDKTGEELNAVLDAQPIIQLGVRSAYQYPAKITGVTWSYNNHALKFALNGAEWVTAAADPDNLDAQKFQARIDGENYQLKIVGNLASQENVANRQISYDVNYACNGMTDTVQGSVDVLIQAAGSNSHMLQITATSVELDDKTPSTTLTAVGMYGTEYVKIGQDSGYSIKWYQDGEEMKEQPGAKLTVNRNMVTGGSLFIAKLFLNGSAVAQDSQRINDTADEYQIQAIPTAAGANWLGVNHNATYNLSLLKDGKDYAGGNVTYKWDVYDAMGNKKPLGQQEPTGTGSLVTVLYEYASVGTGADAYYADCDVQVTAEIQ